MKSFVVRLDGWIYGEGLDLGTLKSKYYIWMINWNLDFDQILTFQNLEFQITLKGKEFEIMALIWNPNPNHSKRKPEELSLSLLS